MSTLDSIVTGRNLVMTSHGLLQALRLGPAKEKLEFYSFQL